MIKIVVDRYEGNDFDTGRDTFECLKVDYKILGNGALNMMVDTTFVAYASGIWRTVRIEKETPTDA